MVIPCKVISCNGLGHGKGSDFDGRFVIMEFNRIVIVCPIDYVCINIIFYIIF